MPSALQERVRELEIETDRIKKQMLVRSRSEWPLALAKLQAAYAELEQGYAALAVECILERSPQQPLASTALQGIVDLS
jgi:hypothetical protein